MGRAVMGLIVLASVAHADPAKWTLPVTADWADVTAEAALRPPVVASRKAATEGGGTYELTAYQNATNGAQLNIVTVEMPGIAATPAKLAEFEAGVRAATTKGATEVSYTKDVAAAAWSVTQRVSGPEKGFVTRRFLGFHPTAGLRMVAVSCAGDAAVCDPIVASAAMTTSDLRALSSLDAGEPSLFRRYGYMIGMVLFGLALLGGALWKRRSNKAV
jgi:hypothetical protein